MNSMGLIRHWRQENVALSLRCVGGRRWLIDRSQEATQGGFAVHSRVSRESGYTVSCHVTVDSSTLGRGTL